MINQMKEKKVMYRSVVVDRLKVLKTRKTRWYGSWQDAKLAGEKMVNKNKFDRLFSFVIDDEKYIY